MKINFNKLLVVLFLAFAVNKSAYAQLTVPSYTACPNQVITANATWNNASNISYSLYAPPTGVNGPPVSAWGPGSSFTIAQPGPTPPAPATIIYTLVAVGIYGGVSTTNTATFSLSIFPPAPMVVTNPPDICRGNCVTVNLPSGGNIYTYTSAIAPNGSSNSNVINICPNASGAIFFTSVINGCTVTGQTNVNVSPVTVFAISTPTSGCEGQVGCITLTCNLPGGDPFSYQWEDKYNNPIPGATSPTLVIGGTAPNNCSPLSISSDGIYRIRASQPFNTINCPYTATTQVNVVPTSPVVASASPNSNVCQGSNLNLSASAPGATAWQWVGPGFTSNIANPVIPSALPTHSGSYTVSAIFQAFITCTQTTAITVSVVPVSQPVITMPLNVCQGDAFLINGSSANNPISYTWSGPLFTGTVPTSGQTIPITDVPTSASGTQFLTVVYSIGTTQCPVTSSVQLNVVPVNSVSVVPPTPVCSPDHAFLQALASGASQYSWIGPNGFAMQGANVWVNSPNTNASGIYSVTAYFGSGGSLVCSSSNTVMLTVYPVLHFSLVPRQEICYNTPITLMGPSGATSYSWVSSTGLTSTDKDIVFNSAQPNNSGTYTLNVSLGPCNSSAETVLSVLTPISFTLRPFDRTVCRGDTISLEGGVTGGSENYAYVWNPAVYLESSTGPQQQAIPLGTIIYNLIVHDVACPNYTIAHPFTVKVNQPPVPDLQLARDYGCVPLCLQYDPKTKKEAAITTFDFGGLRVMQADTSGVLNYCLDQPGTYNLKIYSKGKNGCSGYYEYMNPIVVNPKPGADFYWTPETPTTNDQLTFYPIYRNEPIVYESWNFLGGVTLGDTTMNNLPGKGDTTNVKNPTRLYENFGTYPVVLIAKNDKDCIDTVYKLVKVIDELQIFVPNSFTPNDDGINDVFMAKGSGMKPENFTMDIFTRAGTNIFTTKDINEGWDGKFKGEVMKDAIYIYKIKVVGMNGEGRKELTGYFSLLK